MVCGLWSVVLCLGLILGSVWSACACHAWAGSAIGRVSCLGRRIVLSLHPAHIRIAHGLPVRQSSNHCSQGRRVIVFCPHLSPSTASLLWAPPNQDATPQRRSGPTRWTFRHFFAISCCCCCCCCGASASASASSAAMTVIWWVPAPWAAGEASKAMRPAHWVGEGTLVAAGAGWCLLVLAHP